MFNLTAFTDAFGVVMLCFVVGAIFNVIISVLKTWRMK